MPSVTDFNQARMGAICLAVTGLLLLVVAAALFCLAMPAIWSLGCGVTGSALFSVGSRKQARITRGMEYRLGMAA